MVIYSSASLSTLLGGERRKERREGDDGEKKKPVRVIEERDTGHFLARGLVVPRKK